ncbi:MAG: endo-1,4-beta-D-glucanase Y [Myxococcota bacterium]|jgi:endo-1,4-beta-D-glucanase Y
MLKSFIPVLLSTLPFMGTATADCPTEPSAHWQAYVSAFVESDGRVVDRTDGGKSTSEGQAYGMFFALVNNDRKTFDKALAWAEKTLAGGDLHKNLPAWLYGKDRKTGRLRILDKNPASDADIWMGYLLIEAARLWVEPTYERMGRKIIENVVKHEVVDMAGLGPMVLPGPHGFVVREAKTWRLNPSYLPLPVLRRLAAEPELGPWADIAKNTVRMLVEAAPRGFHGDWIAWDHEDGFMVDPNTGPIGSYDAIRTYLWAGMTHASDPAADALMRATRGAYEFYSANGEPPEKVDIVTGETGTNAGPIGFYAALLPYVERLGDSSEIDKLRAHIDATRDGDLYGEPATYYDQNLVLFALGHSDGQYSFDENGRLNTKWSNRCEDR